ncbi:MAG: dihydrodipicolinate reductase C-terminal domain-containing protein [Kibdelosporangium sp.]
MSADLVLGIVGATGRLGTAVLGECARQGVRVGVEAASTGWRITVDATVLVDASGPGALDDTIGYCERTGAALIYAVSSVPAEGCDRLAGLSTQVPVVLADNLSLGHWLQVSLIRSVASLTRGFPRQPRVSVFERHPVTKADRPSASAKSLAAEWDPPAAIDSRRAGMPVSDHVAVFDLPGVCLTIGHHVGDLRAAATGLLAAAGHVRGGSPGLLRIFDVYTDIYGARSR